MDFPLLKFGWLFVFFQWVWGLPTMNAIRDGGRLSDGMVPSSPAEVLFGYMRQLIDVVVGGRVYGPRQSEQNTSTPDEIVTQAYIFLGKNLLTGTHKEYGFRYSFSMPSSYKYGPSQWLWGIFSGKEL